MDQPQNKFSLPPNPPTPDPDLPDHDPIGEEMIEVGLDPNQVPTDAYLKARAMAVKGDLRTIGELRRAAVVAAK